MSSSASSPSPVRDGAWREEDEEEGEQEKGKRRQSQPSSPPTRHSANTATDDFELTDEVEWGPRPDEDGYDTDQTLAPRPRKSRPSDPCGCVSPDGVEPTCRDLSCLLFACQEECRSNCVPTCRNKRLQRREFAPTEVFDAGPAKGRGLRLAPDAQPVHRGDFLGEYVGRAVKESCLGRLFRRYQLDRRLYIMALGDSVYLDARAKGGVCRYINHSCEPNCHVERWRVKGLLRAAVVASATIQPGEELTFDYQWQRQRGRAPTVCHCGARTCRGTLELPPAADGDGGGDASVEEATTDDDWETVAAADQTLVNRTVKVHSKEHGDGDDGNTWLVGEVTGYDADKRLHCILYKHSMTERWEKLERKEWMALKVATDNPVIAKKVQRRPSPENAGSGLLMLTGGGTRGGGGGGAPPRQVSKNYLYVQTPIKEAWFTTHNLKERCERNCQVQITAQQMARPPLPPDETDPEDAEKYAALDRSRDGTVWKLTVAGANVPRAVTILEKNVAYLEKKLAEDAARSSSSGPSTEPVHEVIFPRLISDAVQRNLPIVREKCRCVNLTFAHSESKSKQFSRICLEGSLASDVEKAKEHLWSMLLQLCAEASAPTAPNKIPRHLGFLGGALRPFQFRLLCDSAASPGNHHHHHRSSSRSLATTSTDACEEDLNGSPFIKSFESTQQCTVWVQAREDKGRVNSQNRVVDEPTPDEPRKIYFGCRPSEVARLGVLIQTRASELARGVKYLSLGADRVYQPLMMKNGGDFFKFVRQVTGATVTVDPMTGDHLRIDGRLAPENAVDVQLTEEIQTMAEGERASLAEEIVRLQIERYRDLCAREYPWIFGRDWTLTAVSATDSTDSRQPAGSIGTLDRATVGHCGVEIAETVSNLGLPGSIAGHAAIILYRFVNCTEEFTTNLKSREAVVACVFLANKAQKSAKWKRLDAVLEAGYKAFYPGSPFDRNKEEVIVLEERVITAEKEILEKVDYDVFWNDVEWINIAATGSGKMSSDFVKQVFDITFSGPILSAGAEVWLKYGVEYVFAAAAAFLKANLSDVLSALSLIPLKVSQAAEILAISAKLDRLSSTKRAFHPLLEGGRERLEKQLPRVKETCLKLTTDAFLKSSTETSSMASAAEQRYRIIGERSRRRQMIRGVPRNLVNESVLPIIDGIATESSCSIYIGESSEDDKEDIVFDGSWRAVALADHLLRTRVQGVAVLPQPVDTSGDLADCPKLQAKSKPGLLNSNDILCAEGWDGTMPAETGKDSKDPNPQLGGKSCIAGKISESAMDEAGLRWWISPKNGPSPSGSIAEMCRIRAEQSSYLDVLVNMTKSLVGHTDTFPLLSSRKSGSVGECSLPLSMQQWPPEKVSRAENKNEEKLNKKSKEKPVEMGFSAAALQELQLLKQLHGTISTPQGHPNFVLPIAISFPRNDEQSPVTKKTPEHNGNSAVFSPDDQIFSLFRSNEENAKVADREKKVKDCPNLIFSPAPFVMHRFMSRKLRRTDDVLIRPTLLAAWFHDILSALVHLHSSHVILRTVQSDQIWIDQAGVAKIGTLYRSTTLPVDERKESPSPLELALSAKKKKKKDENDIPSNSYVAPEILLGSPKYSKESDVWAVGCLLANLLLSKPLFSGKDRQSLLTSQFKVVGTPSVNNYNESVKFPHYVKPEKKYHRGLVDKALEHLLKDQASQHARAIDLIARMLCLDPRERCTAEEALGHDFMNDYLEKCRSYTNRHQYVADWLALKERMTQMKDEEKNKEKSRKRKEMMVAAFKTATGDDDDDLYDLEEIMEEGPKKKSKS